MKDLIHIEEKKNKLLKIKILQSKIKIEKLEN